MKTDHSKRVVGKPSEKQKKFYSVVLDAQLKAIETIRDGVKAGVINDRENLVQPFVASTRWRRLP